MKIYHGGSVVIEKPEIRIGAYNKDFGHGFYCTEFQTQVECWAKRFAMQMHLIVYDMLQIMR